MLTTQTKKPILRLEAQNHDHRTDRLTKKVILAIDPTRNAVTSNTWTKSMTSQVLLQLCLVICSLDKKLTITQQVGWQPTCQKRSAKSMNNTSHPGPRHDRKIGSAYSLKNYTKTPTVVINNKSSSQLQQTEKCTLTTNSY